MEGLATDPVTLLEIDYIDALSRFALASGKASFLRSMNHTKRLSAVEADGPMPRAGGKHELV